jgi:hypothetical protein
MSDRGAQDIFGTLFALLGAHSPVPYLYKELSETMWAKAKQFDTSPRDWQCDDELIALGLAKRGISKEYPEDGEITLYKGLDYK